MAPADPPVVQECVEGYVYTRDPRRLLLLRRPPARGRIWVPVSGKVEPRDADFPSALRRELAEETGWVSFLRLEPLDWEVPFDGPDGRRWRLHAYAVERSDAAAPALSEEHDAFDWVPFEEGIRRLHYEDNREAARRLDRRLDADHSHPSPNV